MIRRNINIIVLILFLVPNLSWAADYKQWIPYIPDKLGGLKDSSEANGMNMNSGGTTMSKLDKLYKEGNKEITLTISYVKRNDDPGSNTKPQEPMSMELGPIVMKTIKIQGFDAIYQYDKQEKNALITLQLGPEATVLLTASGIGKESEKYYTGLFDDINLKKIYASF